MSEEENTSANVQKWISTISTYEREFKKWEGRSDKIVKIYRDNDAKAITGASATNFNILWSNVQTCIPAVFARLPKPDVSRRFRDNDPVGRVASMMLERALEFEIDHYSDYRSAMANCVLDRFLGGRGTAWVRYEPHFKAAESGMPEDGFQITEDADEAEETPEAQEEIDYECAPVDYVHWKDFGHSVARTWEEVTSVWRCCYMTRPALVERFGKDIGNKIPLDTRPDDAKTSSTIDEQYQAAVYEIWDKSTNRVYWVSKSLNDIIDERDDPLQLEGFFPCPPPLYATTTTESLVPVPDFKLYQDQANELNVLAGRIDGLIKALQVRGIYDASVPELQRLFTEGDNNKLLPVKNWQAFSEKQGLRGAIDLVDIAPIAMALVEAYKAVDFVKNEIYEIMGIADILRGSNNPAETATASRMKGQFGGMRLRAMQAKVVQFATEILQIKAQVICQHFQPETIFALSAADQLSESDKQYVIPAIEMLKNNPMRGFRIEVSSDSMVYMEEQQEKADRIEFLSAASKYINEVLPVAQQHPQIAPLLVEMMKFGVTGFRVGKSIEGMFDQTLDDLRKQAAQPQQPRPDPEMMKLQMQGQQSAQALQLKAQLDQQHEQSRQQFEWQKMRAELMLERHRAELDAQIEQSKQQEQAKEELARNEIEAQRAKLEHDQQMEADQLKMFYDNEKSKRDEDFNRWKVELENSTKLTVADIAAGKTSMEQEIAEKTAAMEVIENLKADEMQQMRGQLQLMMESMQKQHEPNEIVYGDDGKAIGAMKNGEYHELVRDENGRPKKLQRVVQPLEQDQQTDKEY